MYWGAVANIDILKYIFGIELNYSCTGELVKVASALNALTSV